MARIITKELAEKIVRKLGAARQHAKPTTFTGSFMKEC